MGTEEIAPPLLAVADIFYREMRSGRNGAVLLRATTPSGDSADVVVKLAGRLHGYAPVPYLVEWLAGAIGQQLGINIPGSMEVMISTEFAESLTEPIRSVAIESTGSAFGSVHHTGPFTQWFGEILLPMELRQAAAELIAFDIFIHNSDRRTDNPNLFVSKREVLAIDHDAAFSFIVPILGSPPDPAVDPLWDTLGNHVFSGRFGRKAPSLERFHEAVEGLTDEVLDAIGKATSNAWQTGLADKKLGTILDVMRRRRDAIERWLPDVEKWINK